MRKSNAADRANTAKKFPELLLSVTMSQDEFTRFSKLVQELCGIKMPDVKKTMLEARLRKRMRILGFGTFKEYWSYVDSPQGKKNELVHLIDVVTTNKTDFFREHAHLEYLYNKALPDLLNQRQGSGMTGIRIWSAGCSTGKEAYSIAMVMTEFSENVKSLDFSILGTDISTKALRTAHKGIYDQEDEENIPAPYRRKYLLRSRDRSKGLIRVAPEIRSLVAFGRLNFLDEEYGLKFPFDIIFCRNVMIYFDRSNQERILKRICSNLEPGGYLFTGHSETLHRMDLPLNALAPSVYRKDL